MAFKKPDSQPNFTELEQQIADFWETNETFKKSVKQREGAQPWRFYDGPPFISGTPHYGHIKDFVVKDVMPRYWTMKGFYAPRVWGWDCHGLPIENKVEKKLGIRSKLEVEKMGIDKYIQECYNYTRETSAEWPWYVKRMGRWIDYDHAYRTMDQDYMETIWWAFKSLWDKGLVYKGWRSSLYSTDSATPVSNFEIAMDNTYEDVEDDAVTVKFELNNDNKLQELTHSGEMAVFMLSWTTTPWTLSANFALAVNPEEEYALVRVLKENVGLTGTWVIPELPFDHNKFQQTKIEEYLLSAPGEKAVKIGKKFYHAKGDNLKEIQQGDYQKLAKEATAAAVIKTRYYYPLTGTDSDEAELSQSTRRDQPQALIDLYGGELEGLQLVNVEFDSPLEYQAFKASLPDWFGIEVTGMDVKDVLQNQAALSTNPPPQQSSRAWIRRL